MSFRFRNDPRTLENTTDVISVTVTGQFALVYLTNMVTLFKLLKEKVHRISEALKFLNNAGAT